MTNNIQSVQFSTVPALNIHPSLKKNMILPIWHNVNVEEVLRT